VFALDFAACYNFNSNRQLPFVEFLHSLVRHRCETLPDSPSCRLQQTAFVRPVIMVAAAACALLLQQRTGLAEASVSRCLGSSGPSGMPSDVATGAKALQTHDGPQRDS